MIDARNSETFLEDQRKNKKNPWPGTSQKIHSEAKRKVEICRKLVLSLSKKFFGQKPHSWPNGAICYLIHITAENWLWHITFQLSFFKNPFSRFTRTIINITKWIHGKKNKKNKNLILGFATELLGKSSALCQVLVSSFEVIKKVPFTSEMGKVPDGTGCSQVIRHSLLERKPNRQDEELPFNKYLVIMLIFKSHNQSKSKSHLNGIYKRIRKWRKWGHVSKPIWFHLSPIPFILYWFLTG